MGENDLRIVVEQPTDWIGSVVIPVAAILVSSLIAIWIASSERRAAERAHVRHAAVGLIRELGEMISAAKTRDPAIINEQVDDLMNEVNSFSALLPARKQPVPQFVALVVSRSIRTNDVARIGATAAWVSAAVDNWLRGELPVRSFRSAMPDDELDEWIKQVDPADWSKVVTGQMRL